MATESVQTITVSAFGGETPLDDFEITFRYGPSGAPLGALVKGKEVGAEVATVLLEAVTSAAPHMVCVGGRIDLATMVGAYLSNTIQAAARVVQRA